MPYFPSGGLGLPIDLTGAIAATRYVGGTATGAPVSGTFIAGDYVITQDGSVFICTVGGTPGTWVQAGGAGSGLPAGGTIGQTVGNTGSGTGAWQGPSNETAAAVLINATSTGDAGNRSDHFPGTSLNVKWTQEVGTGSVVVANSAANFLGGTNSVWAEAYTPSGAFTIEIRVSLIIPSAGSCVLLVKDSSSGFATGNGVGVQITPSSAVTSVGFFTLDSGTFNGAGAAVTLIQTGGYVYLRMTRDGSNQWNAFYSVDRARWTAYGTGNTAKTITAAKIALYISGSGVPFAVDFVDVTA